MNIRLTILFIFFLSCVFGKNATKEAYLKKADYFIQEQHVDSCLYYLSLINDDDPAVSFRKNVMSILRSDKSEEEVITTMDSIIAANVEAPFSNLAKINYIGYYTELMIADDSKNSYNLSVINQAVALHEKSEKKDSFLLMHLLHNKGNLLYELDRNIEATGVLEKALAIAQQIDTRNESMIGVIYFNLANAYSGLFDFQKSYELVEKSEAELSKLENPNLDYLQTVYLDLFSTSLDFSYIEKARNYLNKSAKLYENKKKEITRGNPEAIARKEISLLYNYMRLYSETKDLENGKKTLEEATEKFGDNKDPFFKLRLAAIYNYMGELYVKDQPEKSFKYYQKAIEIYDNKDDLRYGLMFEFNLGKAYLNSKNYKKARETSASIIRKGESINDYRLSFFYFYDVKALLEQGYFEESLPRFNQLVAFQNDSDVEIDLVTQKGIPEFIPKSNLDAAYLLSSAAQTIETHIPDSRESNMAMNSLYQLAIKLFQSNFKQALFNEKSQKEYEMMLEGLLKTDAYLGQSGLSYDEIIRFSENATSRYLWEKFKFKNKRLDLLDKETLAKIQELRSQITDLKLGNTGMDSIEISAEIFERELDLERIELENRNKFNSFYQYEDFDFNFAAFKSKLSDDQLVLKYEFLDSMLYVYEITKDTISIQPLDSLQIINEKVQQFVNLLRTPNSDVQELNALGGVLYNILLPESLKPEILIVADGLLNYLPFDLLRKNGMYLLENNIVSNASSLSLLELAENDNKINNAMIIAPSYDQYILNDQQLAVRGAAYDLEGALAEAEAISDIINSKKYIRESANKALFVKEAGSFDLLHLSMHSFMNDEDPELSSLVFYDGDDDNELFISELYGMNLKAKLAVLSACNTGVGKEKTGEGMVSVNRAFTYAGVPSIVSSLWSAPDKATKELMTAFYGELKQGESKASALRNAKLNYIQNQTVDGLKHPFFWGSFILHGNTEPLVFKGNNLNFRITAFIAVLIFLIGYFIGKKKLKTS
ncbi:CHAT domain-containing protein [Portibacter lacus]|nr:CHAT domain-containing protein [Portibacter lacus]